MNIKLLASFRNTVINKRSISTTLKSLSLSGCQIRRTSLMAPLKQFDLFTKNQTAYLKGITLVLDKIATKMPMVGLEVRAGYLALRKLAIEL